MFYIGLYRENGLNLPSFEQDWTGAHSTVEKFRATMALLFYNWLSEIIILARNIKPNEKLVFISTKGQADL